MRYLDAPQCDGGQVEGNGDRECGSESRVRPHFRRIFVGPFRSPPNSVDRAVPSGSLKHDQTRVRCEPELAIARSEVQPILPVLASRATKRPPQGGAGSKRFVLGWDPGAGQ